MGEFERGLPASFHETIHRRVVTMAVSQKHIKVSGMKMFDTEMIYARAMPCSQRIYDTKNLMAPELSPRTASMFDNSGDMRVSKTKAVLKNDLKVEVARGHVAVDASFLGGCAVLWVVLWPNGGIVQDILNNFRRHIHLESSDVYLVFDRYTAGSIKESIRSDRDQGASRVYEQRPLAMLPAQKVALTVSRNKTQLVDLIMENLQAHKHVSNGKLVITGNDNQLSTRCSWTINIVIVSCYGYSESASLPDARQKIWSLRVARSIDAAPKIQTLPPTNEAFVENVARAHLQVAIWKQALQRNPPNMDPLTHGWTQRGGSTSITLTTIADDVTLTPD